MKLIEKLSGEYFKNSKCEYNCAESAFEAGFRKAVEMAAKEAESMENPKSITDDGFGEYIALEIRKLGEKEVKHRD